jgi:hypothetical protein
MIRRDFVLARAKPKAWAALGEDEIKPDDWLSPSRSIQTVC